MNGRRVARRQGVLAHASLLVIGILLLSGCALLPGNPGEPACPPETSTAGAGETDTADPCPETTTPVPETVTPPPETVTPPPETVTPPPVVVPPGIPAEALVSVRADPDTDHAYAPDVLEVPVGTAVTWVFEDKGPTGTAAVPHNVVSAPDATEEFESEVLTEGTFTHIFTQEGSNPYVCTLHPGMEGVVEVVAAP